MNLLLRKHFVESQQAPQAKPMAAAIRAEPLEAWSKTELVRHARELGINASGRWHKETIIRKIKELNNGTN